MARAVVNVTDLSQIGGKGLGPVTAVIGVTERGPLLTPVLIRNWPEYERTFGRILTDYDFPLLCKRALDGGATLLIIRMVDFDDVEDPTSFKGVVAEDAVTLSGKTVTATAANVGVWGNSLVVDFVSPRSGTNGKLDVKLTYALQPSLNYTFYDFPEEPTDGDFDAFNAQQSLVVLGATAGIVLNNTVSLSLEDGEDDYAVLSGNVLPMHLATLDDKVYTRLAMFEQYGALPWGESRYYAYLNGYGDPNLSKDVSFYYSGLKEGDAGDALALRNCTSPFDDNTPIDDYRVRMFFGGIKIKHPVTGLPHTLSVIGDVIGIRSATDVKEYPWISEAGQKRGRIAGATGVFYNVGTPARRNEADALDRNGVNLTIDHPDFGTVLWGNSTLQRADTLLKHANVAELLLYVKRRLKTIIDTELFEPNDIQTWRNIHRAVVAEMEFIKTNRGLYGYTYAGDQDVDDIADAVYNTPDSIANGEYRFTLELQPTAALKYVVADVVVTKTGVTA
jgi:hypothetical protein